MRMGHRHGPASFVEGVAEPAAPAGRGCWQGKRGRICLRTMKTVSDLLQGKGRDVWSVTPDSTVYEALALMAERRIGAVVVREGPRVVGILSERDYARQVVLKGKTSRETPVREIMTSRVVYVRPQQSVEDCMAIMTDKRVRHLPVIERDELVGLVSIGDVVKAVISEKQFIIEQLENYIAQG